MASGSSRRALAAAVAFLLVFESSCVMAVATWAIKQQQEIIENDNRMQVGLWLRENGSPTDRVYLEPLGYIGYFSGLQMMDYPGLVCPLNTQLIREGKNFYTIPEVTKPDWIVLRGYEATDMTKQPYFSKNYELAREFNVLDRIRRHRFVEGLKYLRMDSIYLLYKKKRSAGDTPNLVSGR
jgi:hypothetical protein